MQAEISQQVECIDDNIATTSTSTNTTTTTNNTSIITTSSMVFTAGNSIPNNLSFYVSSSDDTTFHKNDYYLDCRSNANQFSGIPFENITDLQTSPQVFKWGNSSNNFNEFYVSTEGKRDINNELFCSKLPYKHLEFTSKKLSFESLYHKSSSAVKYKSNVWIGKRRFNVYSRELFKRSSKISHQKVEPFSSLLHLAILDYNRLLDQNNKSILSKKLVGINAHVYNSVFPEVEFNAPNIKKKINSHQVYKTLKNKLSSKCQRPFYSQQNSIDRGMYNIQQSHSCEDLLIDSYHNKETSFKMNNKDAKKHKFSPLVGGSCSSLSQLNVQNKFGSVYNKQVMHDHYQTFHGTSSNFVGSNRPNIFNVYKNKLDEDYNDYNFVENDDNADTTVPMNNGNNIFNENIDDDEDTNQSTLSSSSSIDIENEKSNDELLLIARRKKLFTPKRVTSLSSIVYDKRNSKQHTNHHQYFHHHLNHQQQQKPHHQSCYQPLMKQPLQHQIQKNQVQKPSKISLPYSISTISYAQKPLSNTLHRKSVDFSQYLTSSVKKNVYNFTSKTVPPSRTISPLSSPLQSRAGTPVDFGARNRNNTPYLNITKLSNQLHKVPFYLPYLQTQNVRDKSYSPLPLLTTETPNSTASTSSTVFYNNQNTQTLYGMSTDMVVVSTNNLITPTTSSASSVMSWQTPVVRI